MRWGAVAVWARGIRFSERLRVVVLAGHSLTLFGPPFHFLSGTCSMGPFSRAQSRVHGMCERRIRKLCCMESRLPAPSPSPCTGS